MSPKMSLKMSPKMSQNVSKMSLPLPPPPPPPPPSPQISFPLSISTSSSSITIRTLTTHTPMDQIDQSLLNLAQCESLMDSAERKAEIFRIKTTQPIFEKRRHILITIPKFWYIVLAENDDFSDYISVEDLKYLETIKEIHVHYDVADNEDTSDLTVNKDFSITITFDDVAEASVPPQTVTKHFVTSVEDGEEKLSSKAVDVKWPQELDYINPGLIKANKSKHDFSDDDKKNYRRGMKSFFSWFAWTGEKPGKEFRNGEDLTRLIIDDLFPYAVKYYTEALPGADEEDEDSSDPEELDIEGEGEEGEGEEGEGEEEEEGDEGSNKRRKVD